MGCKHECAFARCAVGVGFCGRAADDRDGEGDENERHGWRGMFIWRPFPWNESTLKWPLIF